MLSTKIRNPAGAGRYHEGTTQSLRRHLESCFKHKFGSGSLPEIGLKGSRNTVGLVSPHAGYMASGPVAAVALRRPGSDGSLSLFVIMGPNQSIDPVAALMTLDKKMGVKKVELLRYNTNGHIDRSVTEVQLLDTLL